MPLLCALQAAASALPEQAVALADHVADDWDVHLVVSIPSCLWAIAQHACVWLGLGHELMPSGACHDYYDVSSLSLVAEV